ncbi:hypothetical protein C8R43DRAFT_946937 [Mycena crocata]|nr:hypothetical protein C8R43DRAFT_946937 [Mycena crocata]
MPSTLPLKFTSYLNPFSTQSNLVNLPPEFSLIRFPTTLLDDCDIFEMRSTSSNIRVNTSLVYASQYDHYAQLFRSPICFNFNFYNRVDAHHPSVSTSSIQFFSADFNLRSIPSSTHLGTTPSTPNSIWRQYPH